MTVVIDTNVLVVANDRETEQATAECVLRCVERLMRIRASERIALDAGQEILAEYFRHANRSGEPGPGDAFARWIFDNQWTQAYCDLVPITLLETGCYQEFPTDPRLDKFDLSDRKFVAVSIAHPERPPILNAVDSDWEEFRAAFTQHGVEIEAVCP